jgi:anti-sigma regulatory factor (Ser/Thr protein kinase)
VDDDEPTQEIPVVGADDDDGPTYDRVFLGALDQTHALRAGLRAYLRDCPVADDVVLIASEFAANAVLHSPSNQTFFICRAEVFPDHVRVEVEDLGGPWLRAAVDNERPHGLDIVQMLAEWGTTVRACDHMRVTWAEVPYKQETPP